MLSQHIEKMAEQIEMEKAQGKSQSAVQTATVSSDSKVETQEKSEPVFYASIAYLQNTDDTQLFDRLQEQGDYKRILQEAAEYDFGEAPDLSQTFTSPVQNRGDDLLDENDHYAVVYNNNVGGTYEVFRKVNE